MTRLPFKTLVFLSTLAALLAMLWLACAPLSAYFLERGKRANKEWRLDDAARLLAWAVRLDSGSIEARFEKGMCEQLRGDYAASQLEFDRLPAHDVRDLSLRARLLKAAGVNRFQANEPESAAKLFRESVELAQRAGDRHTEASALIHESQPLYSALGRLNEAITNLEAALRIGRETGDEIVQADALLNLGYLHWWYKAEQERPLREFYEPALAIYKRHNNLRGVANSLSRIAIVWSLQRRSDVAVPLQQESLAIRRRIGDLAGMCDSYISIGKLYEEGGNFRTARVFYARGLELAKRTGNRLKENQAETYIASVHLNLGEFAEPIEIYERLLERDRALPLRAKTRMGSLAYAHALRGDHARAREYCDRALALHRQIGASDDRFLAWIKVVQADALVGLGSLDEAYELLTEARALGKGAHTLDGWTAWYYYHVVLAELLSKRNQRDAVFDQLWETADAEMRVFSDAGVGLVPGPLPRDSSRLFSLLVEKSSAGNSDEQPISVRPEDELAFRFLEQWRYRSYRNLILQISDRKSNALPAEQRRDARARIQQVVEQTENTRDTRAARAQLTRAYADYEDLILHAELTESQFRLMRSGRPASLAEVQTSLDGETALIEYLFVDDRIYALIITQKTLRIVPLAAGRASLAVKVKLFRSLAFETGSGEQSSDTTHEDWLPVARSLRRQLIDPLEQSNALTGVTRLGLIPFGFLHDLPFAALARTADDGNDRFLVEDFTLFHLPSASFLKSQTSTRSYEAEGSNSREAIGFGLNGQGTAELAALEFAEDEAQAIAGILNGSARIGSAASETELKRQAPKYKLIHLATHAITDAEMPLLSSMQFGRTAEDDGNLTVREIFNLGLDARLVTLGACRTAQSSSAGGSSHAEVDRVGLTEAFLYAGADSVLASLLPINDRPTTEFMKTFYGRLAMSGKADALAQTQREMLRGQLNYSEDGQVRDLTQPRYWAAFVLVGDHR